MKILKSILAAMVIAASTVPVADARVSAHLGVLSCDVSSGIGHILREKQSLRCVYRANASSRGDIYEGTMQEWGIELGATEAGQLVWGVVSATTSGEPSGALAGEYLGVSADASLGVGMGANVLVGGNHRSFSLQPISVEGQTGVNIAGGVTRMTLVHQG